MKFGRYGGLLAALTVAVAVTGLAGLKLVGNESGQPAVKPEQSSIVETMSSEILPSKLGRKIGPPKKGAYIGVFKPGAPFNMAAHDLYMEISPKAPAVVMWFQAWDPRGASAFDSRAVYSVLEKGAIPLITWEPWVPRGEKPAEQPEYSLSSIAEGRHDEYIKSWARAVRDIGSPIMLRPMHEMNGTWYPWCGLANGNTPEQYVVAWRRLHDLFEEEGASNVTWVWSIQHQSSPNSSANSFSTYYPGDEYVDWTSVSGFNWGSSASANGAWRDFDTIYAEPLNYLETLGKPVVLSEFGTVSSGGDKPNWIKQTYTSISIKYPMVKAVVYYDKDEQRARDSQDWSISSVSGSARAYSQSVAPDYFVSAPVAEVQAWRDGLSPGAVKRLDSTRQLYK